MGSTERFLLIDQTASSAFSLVVGIQAARSIGAASFGEFATFFAAYLLCRDVGRVMFAEPQIILALGRRDPARPEDFLAIYTAGALAAGVVAFLVVVSIGWLGVVGGAFAGAGMAALVLVDGIRSLFVADGEATLAAFISIALLFGSVLWTFGLVAVLRVSDPTITVLAALVLTTSGPLAIGVIRLPFVYSRIRLAAPTRRLVSIGWPLLGDFLVSSGLMYGLAFLVASISTVEAGGLRAAQMVTAPIVLLTVAGAQIQLVRESKALARGERMRWREIGRVIWLICLAAALWSAVLRFAGPVLELAFGDVVVPARPLIFPILWFTVSAVPGIMVSTSLRARGAQTGALRARLVTTVLIAPTMCILVVVTGVRTAIITGAVVQAATLPVWYLAGQSHMRDPNLVWNRV